MKKQLPKQGRRGAALILVLIAVAIGLMMVATLLLFILDSESGNQVFKDVIGRV